MNVDSLQPALAAVILLVAIGFYTLLASRNLVKLLIGLQILVKAVVLAFVAAGRVAGQMDLAQSLGTTVVVADTVAVVVGLAFAIRVQRRVGTLDVRALTRLRG